MLSVNTLKPGSELEPLKDASNSSATHSVELSPRPGSAVITTLRSGRAEQQLNERRHNCHKTELLLRIT
ncbi:hypothetical protein MHYP_G00322550 [Metynnis hypsauchen]